ncbi:hypothetical protein XI03_36090 [Bradyrhizobium sp. CCBAU 65884]|nr:hypothetical protein [Bradyrhizobium sp. CCBAU 65884]
MEFTAFPSWKRQKSNFGVFATFLVFLLVYAHSQRAPTTSPRARLQGIGSLGTGSNRGAAGTCIHGKRQTNPAIESAFC